jgi:hypothetical protein
LASRFFTGGKHHTVWIALPREKSIAGWISGRYQSASKVFWPPR